MQLDVPAANPADFTEVEKAAIEEQVERLLQNPHSSHSRRFPTFLRFVVRHTLAGQADGVKERTLGIEIFGRSADYDTASDPIVRVTAAEIRKRIAQYYQEPGHENELRILLPAGSYVPQFVWPQTKEESPAPPATEPEEPAVSSTKEERSRRLWRNLAITACVCLALLLIAFGAFWKASQHSIFESFWTPVLNSSDPVLFCVADQNQYSAIAHRDALNPSHQVLLKDNLTAVVISA